MKQITTLAVIEDGDMALLAMKKRGFGEGWWNGYGGKIQDGESVEDAMVRELEEESGLTARVFKKRAVLDFIFEGTDKKVEMHVFEVTEYDGDLVETEEMRPQWFLKSEIPYDNMWPADRNWFPLFFKGEDIEGFAVFDGETKAYIKSNFKIKSKDDDEAQPSD